MKRRTFDKIVTFVGFGLSVFLLIASGLSRSAAAAAAADPANAELQATAAKASTTVETVFNGESLRVMLLNAYAFWKLGQIELVSAGIALLGAILMLFLSIAGLIHLRRTPLDAMI